MRIRYEYTSYKHSKRATELSHLVSLFTVIASGGLLVSLVMSIIGIVEFANGFSWSEETTEAIIFFVVCVVFVVLRCTKIKAHIEKIAREDWEKYRKGMK